MNHARNIPSEELIDRFWAEGSSDPINALRGMLYKVRKFLREMFPEEENMIVTLRGSYGWNPDLQIELDSEQFEQICKEARRQPEAAAQILSGGALPLYRGDFLAGNDSDWAIPMRRYYQTLYLDVCREVLPLLQSKERWMEVMTICEQAQNVDFAAEDFVTCQMQASSPWASPSRLWSSTGNTGSGSGRNSKSRPRNRWSRFTLSPPACAGGVRERTTS